jgi:hypothetical protein
MLHSHTDKLKANYPFMQFSAQMGAMITDIRTTGVVFRR